MKIRINLIVLSAFAMSLSISSIAAQGKINTYVGKTVPMGNGFIRSWVTTDKSGKPLALGFAFNKAALSGLSKSSDTAYTLSLPPRSPVPPFNHLEADWNYRGHIPEQIYGMPHFDFHFYMLTPAERDAIVLTPETKSIFSKAPSKEYQPQDYIFAPDSEFPRMGSHWIDVNTPELHGHSFTETFIYGFYDGQMVFAEPMASLSFLLSGPKVYKPIKQPQMYQKKGYYPTRYKIRYDAARDRYIVALTDLVKR